MEACTCYAIFLSTLIFLYEHVFHFSAWFRMMTQHRVGGRVGDAGRGRGGVNKPRVTCWFVLCVDVCVCVRVCASAFTVNGRVVLLCHRRTSCCVLTQFLQ